MIKDAYRFALPPLIAGLLCFIPGWKVLGVVLILLGLFVFYFFRDPRRVIPTTPGIIISPADGKVVEIVDEMLDSVMGHRISIFLSIWNVHVQRAPPLAASRTWSIAPAAFTPRSAPTPRVKTNRTL